MKKQDKKVTQCGSWDSIDMKEDKLISRDADTISSIHLYMSEPLHRDTSATKDTLMMLQQADLHFPSISSLKCSEWFVVYTSTNILFLYWNSFMYVLNWKLHNWKGRRESYFYTFDKNINQGAYLHSSITIILFTLTNVRPCHQCG